MRRLLVPLLAPLLAAALLTGCSGDPGSADPTAADGAPPARPAAPAARACYDLDVKAALALSSAAPQVPCRQRHTAVTVHVGTLDPVVDGHLLAVDSPRLQRQVSRTCRAKVDRHVGGSEETRRLSRIQAVWFSPSLDQADAGALWFRCDLVIAGSGDQFTPLPTRTRGLLDRAGALERYGTCGTAAPGAAGFRRVACAQEHTWQARASIDLPPGTAYLSRNAARAADSACRDVEATRATTLTRLRWAFEWPTKAQWNGGQRYGLCWTPD